VSRRIQIEDQRRWNGWMILTEFHINQFESDCKDGGGEPILRRRWRWLAYTIIEPLEVDSTWHDWSTWIIFSVIVLLILDRFSSSVIRDKRYPTYHGPVDLLFLLTYLFSFIHTHVLVVYLCCVAYWLQQQKTAKMTTMVWHPPQVTDGKITKKSKKSLPLVASDREQNFY